MAWVLILAALLLAPATQAAPPVLTGMEPHGAARGHTLRVVLNGDGLSADTTIATDLPATIRVGTPGPGHRTLELTISIAASARPRIYQIRARTAAGLSNSLRFAVSAATEFREEESETPQRIHAIPAVVNGTLDGDDVDRYVVYGKATERRRFEVEAQRLGSPARIQLRIYDSQGRIVGQGSATAGGDPAALVRFPGEGFYTVEVRERSGRAPAGAFYRLKMG